MWSIFLFLHIFRSEIQDTMKIFNKSSQQITWISLWATEVNIADHHPDSHTGLDMAFLCADRLEPLEILELATLAESPIMKLDSLEERDKWETLPVLLFALLGRLLEAVFEYCFCLICSLINESLDNVLVGLTVWSLSSNFWKKDS